MPSFSYGPFRNYIGCIKIDPNTNEQKCIVEALYSNGQRKTLPWVNDPCFGTSFEWDYSGSGTNATSAAILTHALAERVINNKYPERIARMAIAFTSAFLGDKHHADLKNRGFEIPGEIVLAWVLKNEERLLAEYNQQPVWFSAAEIMPPSAKNFVEGTPNSLSTILGGTESRDI